MSVSQQDIATMSRVTVSSATVTTDPYSVMSVKSHGYTNGVLFLQNNAKTTASFQVKDTTGTVINSADISIAGSATGTLAITKLVPGSTTNYVLERLEYGTWVPQSSDPRNVSNQTSLTTDITSMTISSSSVRATIGFTVDPAVTPTPEMVVLVQAKADFDKNTTANMQLINAQAGTGPQTIAVTGLTAATPYTAVLMVRDRTQTNTHFPDGFGYNTIDVKQFTTGVSGSLTLGTPIASSVPVSWTGDSAELYRIVDAKGAVVIADSAPKSTTIYNLVPGTSYAFALQMKSGTTYNNIAAASTTTPTTTLSVNGVTDVSANCVWTSVYSGAAYELSVVSSATKSVVQTLNTSALSQIVKELSPANTYMLTLSVIENGAPVPVSRAPLGTDMSKTAGTDNSAPQQQNSQPAMNNDPTPPAQQPVVMDDSTPSDSTQQTMSADDTSSQQQTTSGKMTKKEKQVEMRIDGIPDHLIDAAHAANAMVKPGVVSHTEIAAVVVLACLVGFGVYRTFHHQ